MAKATTIVFNDQQKKMIDELSVKLGGTSMANTVRQAIFFMHNKLVDVPAYAVKSEPRKPKTAEEKAQDILALENARQKAKEAKKLEIATKLGGKVIEGADGAKSVQWYTYWSKGKDLQELPLMALTEDLLHNQFQGNIEVIKEFHKLK